MNTIQTYQQQIADTLQKTTVTFEYFSDFALDYKRQMEQGQILTEKKTLFSEQTIRQYKSAIEHFITFESLMEKPFGIQEVNTSIIEVFERYLVGQSLTLNSVSLYISKIKAIQNRLIKIGIAYNAIKVSTPKERTTKISFTLNELRQMRSAKLTNSETLCLQVMLVQCFTGLRYSTLCKFLKSPYTYVKEYNGQSYISIVADKTNDEAVIPLSKVVVEILSKANGRINPPSEQYFNRQIKSISRKAGITHHVPVRGTKNGKVQEVFTEKWKLASSHASRRTFISLARTFIHQKSAIMAMTSLKTENLLAHYDRSENVEKIAGIMDNKFFQLDI